jgi:ankyrin repeat protein
MAFARWQSMTLLHWTADRNLLELAQELLKRGANVQAKDSEGQSPLHFGKGIVLFAYLIR